ncbi:hypothetical protein EDD86DRAFT_201321 [Gorgonomyces haynaldii]|nr:hypothetical protein EDD86DRAFT_201321 [Gorgonomyces haynaldii]
MSEPNEETPLLDRPVPVRKQRVTGLDLFRGLIMVFESLDHARDFASNIQIQHEEWNNMTSYEGPQRAIHFFMRAITGLCAPGFMFLMGMGIAYFTASRKKLGWTDARINWHFIVRGLILVFLNFFQFPPAIWIFGWPITVLYALGINIILGSVFLGLEDRLNIWMTQKLVSFGEQAATIAFSVSTFIYLAVAFGISCAITVITNDLPVDFTGLSVWTLLISIPCSNCVPRLGSLYPFIPWLTPVLLGILFGKIFLKYESNKIRIGANLFSFAVYLTLFLILRFNNGFGNIHNELLVPSPLEDVINFLNLTKYPPSLTYLLWTMGINHLIIAICLALPNFSPSNPLMVFGGTALFFYTIHFYIYFIIGIIVNPLFGAPSLGPFLGLWIFGLLLLWPMCARYAQFKSKQGPDSIWRFF